MFGQPIKSIAEIKGSQVTGSKPRKIAVKKNKTLNYQIACDSKLPAITGSTKYGPNRLSYNKFETIAEKVCGLIFRFSLSSYRFKRNRSLSWTVSVSVAKPGSPM